MQNYFVQTIYNFQIACEDSHSKNCFGLQFSYSYAPNQRYALTNKDNLF